MAVTKTGAIIAVWVICGVLIVAIAVVVILLCCRRATRNARGRYRVSSNREDGAGEEGGECKYYPGYERLGGADVCTDPEPGAYAGPRVVHVRRRSSVFAGSSGGGAPDVASAPCDILVNIFYVDPEAASVAALQSKLLGTDGFYSSAFLLYTAPLEFIAPGTYVIQAYAVYETLRAVGPVHQFVFHLTRGDGVAPEQSALWGSGAHGAAAARGLGRSDVEINLASSRAATDAEASVARHGGAGGDNRNALVPAASALSTLGDGTQRWPDRSRPYNALTVPGDRTQDAAAAVPLLPPTITPAEGSVTTRTPIVLSPSERSGTADQIRYSTDGSYPTVLYTGPFYLSLPPESILPEQRLTVTIKAIAVPSGGGGGTAHYTVSDVAEASVRVRHAGYSFFDPDIPAPSMRLRAVDAMLYFDESRNPRGTRTVFQLLYVNQMRRHKAQFSRRRCQLYERNPIPLGEDVAMVYAWTVSEADWFSGGHNKAAHSGRDGLVQSDADDDDESPSGRGSGLLRSVAAVYDCTRAATEQAKPSRKRVEALRKAPHMQLLPPPSICVSCAEMEVEFDAAPANGVIAYTLNNTEPALYDVVPPACAVPVASAAAASASQRLRSASGRTGRSTSRKRPARRARRHRDSNNSDSGSSGSDDENGDVDDNAAAARGDEGGLATYRYEHGKPIKVTLLETEGVYVTARLFFPIMEDVGSEGVTVGAAGGQGGSSGRLVGYRFGNVFHRGFFFAE